MTALRGRNESGPIGLDVLGLGGVSVDETMDVSAFPVPESRATVLRSQRDGGGLTVIALAAAARPGARCGYAGQMGTDPVSDWAIDPMARAGVDMSAVTQHPNGATVKSKIIVGVDDAARTILVERSGETGAIPNQLNADLIRSAGVLLVDDYGVPRMIRAARFALAANRSVFGDFERPQRYQDAREMIDLVEHLIVPESFAQAVTGAASPEQMVNALWSPSRAVICITCGADGYWYRHSDQRVSFGASFPVQAVDSTGCGDVFHGVYALGLSRGIPVGVRLILACAAAALQATREGTQSATPERLEIDNLLAANGQCRLFSKHFGAPEMTTRSKLDTDTAGGRMPGSTSRRRLIGLPKIPSKGSCDGSTCT